MASNDVIKIYITAKEMVAMNAEATFAQFLAGYF